MENVEVNVELKSAVKALLDYLARTGRTKTEVASAIGISPSALSQFIGETYKSPGAIIPKVLSFLATSEEKELAPKRPDFVETSISKSVIDVITYCHIQGVMGSAYGDAGVGKTAGAKEYIRRNPEAIMITVSPVFNSIKGVNSLLCEELRIGERRTNMDMYMSITRKLRSSGRVVIVDEGQHLTINTLEHLRSMITDDAGCGLVLIGNEFINSRMLGKQEAQLAQIFSRRAIRKNVLTTNTEITDIRMLFPRTENTAQDFLLKVAKSKWGIRGAVNVFLNAQNNGDYTKDGLVAIAKFMGIGVA